MSTREMKKVKHLLGFQHMFVVPSTGQTGCSGGLAFLWKNEVQASLVSFSRFHIDMTVRCPDTFRITGF